MMENNNQLNNSTNLNTVQTTPLVQTPTPSNLPKYFIFAILGLVVLSGTAFAGFQLGKNQKEEQLPIAIQPTTAPTQAVTNPTIQPTKIPTISLSTSPTMSLSKTESNNWRTYTSKNYSFQYPNSWADVTENILSTRTEVVSEGNMVVSDGEYYNQKLGRSQTYQEYTNQVVPKSISTTPFNLGNLNGIRYTDKDNSGRSMVNIILSDKPTSTKIFSIIYMSPVSDLETINTILNPILSTFKFTSNETY